MAFSWSGAASGAQNAIVQQQEQARQAAEFDLRRQALMAQLDASKVAQARAARDQQLQEAAITVSQAGELGQGAELSPEIAKSIQGTPYAARLQTRQTLPSHSIGLTGVNTSDAGGRDYSTLAPTRKEMQDTATQSTRDELARSIESGGMTGTSRAKLIGTLVRSGQSLPSDLLKDPQADLSNDVARAQAIGNVQSGFRTKEQEQAHQFRLNEIAATPRGTDTEWVDRGGTPVQIRRGTAQPGDKPYSAQQDKPPTQNQSTAAVYAGRMEQAENIFGSTANDIAGMNPLSYAAQAHSPYAGFQGGTFQSYDQAARNFVNAVMRRESGAAISQGEFDNARSQYLPQPGDNPKTLAQKKANRDYVQQAMKREAGSAYVAPITPPANGARPSADDLIRKYGGGNGR